MDEGGSSASSTQIPLHGSGIIKTKMARQGSLRSPSRARGSDGTRWGLAASWDFALAVNFRPKTPNWGLQPVYGAGMSSLVDFPETFELVAPYVKLGFYNRDQDHTGSKRHRLDLRRPPNEVLHLLLDWTKPCVACGKAMHPFRQRADGSVYYAAACPLKPSDAEKARWVELAASGSEEAVRRALLVASESYGGGCSKGNAASQEYQRVKAAVRARPKEQPSFEEAMALAHGEPVPEPAPLPEEELRVEPVVKGSMWSYFIGSFLGRELVRLKIGESTSPMQKRIRGLQAQQGHREVKLYFFGVTKRYHEKELHRRFADLHEEYEWFTPTGRVLEFAAQACSPEDLCGLPGYDAERDATALGLWDSQTGRLLASL